MLSHKFIFIQNIQAGQESYRSVSRIFYRGAHCVVLCYDICRAESFINLGEWLKEVRQHSAEDVKVYLIGNKSEDNNEDLREVQFEDAVSFAKDNGIHKVFETSAMTGKNVQPMFTCVGKDLFIDWNQSEKAKSP